MFTSYASIVTSQPREGLEMKEGEKKGGEMEGGEEGGEGRGEEAYFFAISL